MTDTRKTQLGAEFDSSGVRKGTREVVEAVRDMGKGVEEGAKTAGKGFDDVGKRSEGAGAAVDRNTKSIVSSIERTTAAMKSGERGTATYFETLAKQRGANLEVLQPYLQQLRQAEVAQRAASGSLDKMGVSAGQTRQALRQLPAQFTDIFTSLQGGQKPLTVLIQQGGQIKDSFGGIGPALRGVAAAINPAVLLLGGLAAGVVATAAAYNKGSAEADVYRKSIILTGNAAGASVGQLGAAAEAVSRSVGTQGKAAEVLGQLAATGRVAAGDLGKLTEAAIRLERAGGPAVEATVSAFAKLGEDPLKASIKLNESTRYLTVSVLEQVRALEEQGRRAEAASLAQAAYADTAIQRSKDLEKTLGTLERAWRGTLDAAKGAWDAFLGIGRAETVQSRLEAVSAELDRRRRATGSPDLSNRSKALLEEQSILQSDARLIKGEADKQAAAARVTEEYARAREANQKWADAALTNTQKVSKAIGEYRANLAKINEGRTQAGLLPLSEAEVSRQEAAIRKSIVGVKELDSTLSSARESAKQWADAITDGQKIQAEAQASSEGLSKSQARLVQYLVSPAYKQHTDAMRQIVVQTFAAANAAEQYAKAEKDRAKALEDGATAQRKYLTELDKSEASADKELQRLRDQFAELTGGKSALEAIVQARLDDAAARAEQNVQAVEGSAYDEAEYERLNRIALKLREVADQRRLNAGVEAEQTAAAEARKALKAIDTESKRTADSMRQSFTDALRRAFESGKGFWASLRDTIITEAKTRLAAGFAEGLTSLVLGNGGSAGGTGAQGGSGSLLQSVQSAQSLYGYGKSLYGYFAGSSAAGTAAAGTATNAALIDSAVGTSGYGASSASAAAGGSSAAGASSFGAYAGYAALIYAATQYASSLYDKGFTGSNQIGDQSYYKLSPENFNDRLFKGLGLSDKWSEILSGSVRLNALFGRAAPRIDAAGISGSIGGGDFTGNAFADITEKGGIFRSDKRYTELKALPEDIGNFLDDASKSVLDQTKEFGAALGLPAEQLANVTKDVRVVLTDDVEANKQELIKALGGYADELVKGYADAVAPLAAYGETTAETIARVGASITQVNQVLDTLGLTALQASIDGGKAATDLQALFGDVGTLQQAASGYLQSYYTDSERAKLATDALGKTLAEFGLQIPATREGFRGLVEAQDLTTEAGREAFTALLGVSDAFAELVPAARAAQDILNERADLERELLTVQGNTAALRELDRAQLDESNRALYDQIRALEDQQAAADKTAEAVKAAADAWNAATSGLTGGVQSAYTVAASTIAAEKQRVETAAQSDLQALEQRADQVRSAFGSLLDTLTGAVQTLTGEASADGGRGQAQQILKDSLTSLQQGRSVDLEAIKSAAGTVSRLSTDGFSTRADFQREIASSSSLLRDIGAASRRDMTAQLGQIAKQQVGVELDRDRQLSVLDDQLQQARDAASTLVKIDDGVQSVADALARLSDAIGAVGLINGTGGETGRWLQTGGSEVFGAAGGAVATRNIGAGLDDTLIRGKSGSVFSATEARTFVNDRLAAGDFSGLVARAIAEGIDSAALDALMGYPAGTSLREALNLGLPAFATGTPYVPSTGPAILHQGERVVTATDNNALTRLLAQANGSGGDDSLLREVLAELRAARVENMAGHHATASYAGKTSTLLDDAINGGNSIQTRAEDTV